MPTTTRQLAKLTGVAEQTVRNYTREYAALLSPQARGEQGPRQFSDADVETFRAIVALRREGVPPVDVIERIRRGDVYIEPTNRPQQATPNEPQPLLLAHNSLQHQINEIRRTQTLLLRAAMLWGALLGAIAGLAFGAFVLWAMWLFGG